MVKAILFEKSVSLNKENLDRDIKKKIEAERNWNTRVKLQYRSASFKVPIWSVYKGDMIKVKDRKNLNNHDKITVKLLYDKSDL